MFTPSSEPRIFGVPPGADFPRAVVENVLARTEGMPPEYLARTQILLPTRRMQRRLIDLFTEQAPRLLPRIHVVTDVSQLVYGADLPAPVSPLRRSLELKELVARLVEVSDTLSSGLVVDLTDSLARLLDEMQGEGVPLEALEHINTDVSSGHWEQSLRFLQTIRGYVEALNEGTADAEARHRSTVELLCRRWQDSPPETPVIVAGSTGSRDTTRLLMKAVAGLPQGAIVLPGFDFDLELQLWSTLAETRDSEDHPQFRFASLLADLAVASDAVEKWGAEPSSLRNRLISLSLSPANVTDQWLTKGPSLGDLIPPTDGLSLIEAAQPRDEALAIAVALRDAVERGKTCALIAPDATLARRVTAALRRWGIEPDESGGTPLSLTAAGRFIRHVASLVGKPARPVDLIALLKHPLTRHGDNRGPSQLITQEFELFLRRHAVTEVTLAVLNRFEKDRSDAIKAWVAWLAPLLSLAQNPVEDTLAAALERQIALAEAFCDDPLALWSGTDGEAVHNVITKFQDEISYTGPVTFPEYSRLLDKALAADSDREKPGVRSDVMIWGTLEARVQGADVVILGGLNEGTWPEQPSPDPWLNRQMRRDLGLLLPERQIGLAAHDFQQAAGAAEVILSRAQRSEDSETVPSRWLNRLLNLLGGLPETGGHEALTRMRQRGQRFIATAEELDRPTTRTPPAHRPAPIPPVHLRPTEFAITDIERLIRDPYAIYARKILNLRPLDPLTPVPDPRLKGSVFHEILEHFFAIDADFATTDTRQRLHEVSWHVLTNNVPWPSTRMQWWGHLASIADWLIDTEATRRDGIDQLGREVQGLFNPAGTRFTLKGTADRIDRRDDGLVIYDYKSGGPPEVKTITHFDRQLLIEAVMAEAGAFTDLPSQTVAQVVHIGVGRNPRTRETALTDVNELSTVLTDLITLLTRFDSEDVGYASRRAMEKLRYEGDYDHLARFGEWDASQAAVPERLR